MTRSTARKTFAASSRSPLQPLSVQKITEMTQKKAAPLLARMTDFEKNRFSLEWKRVQALSDLIQEGAGGFEDLKGLTHLFNLTAAGRVVRDMRFDLSHGVAIETARFFGPAFQGEPYIRLLQAMTPDQKGHLVVADIDRMGLSRRRAKGDFMASEGRERLRLYDETGFCGLFLEYPEQTIKALSAPGFTGVLKGRHLKAPYQSLALPLSMLIQQQARGTLKIKPLEMREIR